MDATPPGVVEWMPVGWCLFLAIFINFIAQKNLSKVSRRWVDSSEDMRRRTILRISTSPTKIFFIWRFCQLWFYTDDAIRTNQDNIQAKTRSALRVSNKASSLVWRLSKSFFSSLVAAAIYGYELLKTLPPTFDDVLHHGGSIMLTYIIYRSPIATQEPHLVNMIRLIGVASFFSLV